MKSQGEVTVGREIFVMAEQKKGKIEEPTRSLLSEGKRLKTLWNGSLSLSAIVLGHGLHSLETELGRYGADKVYYFEDRQLERFQPELYTNLIAEFVKEKDPVFFLLGATPLGSELAPRIAARLKAGLVTNCVDIQVDRGYPEAIKLSSNDYLYQRVLFRDSGLKMATFAPDITTKQTPDDTRRAEVIRIPPRIDPEQIKTKFLEMIKEDPKTIGLEEADVIVCGGRGVGKGNFGMVHQLAEILNGSVGATRPVIDWGILPYERQIGQTGIKVSPTFLMTCGVSGANEFTTGIEDSKLVAAINVDPKARIFKFADLGIIGDLRKMIPLLIDELKKNKKNNGERGEP